MTIHAQYGLTRVINASGTYTPLGVSRSSAHVGQIVAGALGEFFIIDELQKVLSREVAGMTGAEAAAVTHCVAAGITLSVAAAMAGDAQHAVAALPDASGMPNRVVIPAGHVVNYGHSILTDIRIAGATPVIAGTEADCSVRDLEAALDHDRSSCLLLVSSRLTRGRPIDLAKAVEAAHRRGVPAIIDGAAQDLRIDALLAMGADIVLVSAHKYLASPTAGLILGKRSLVEACLAHERGIGRAMKATKEAILGVLAALHERSRLDLEAWRAEQLRKVDWFVQRANRIHGIHATALPDPAGMPFSRVRIQVNSTSDDWNASVLAKVLKAGTPSIWTMEQNINDGVLMLELVPLVEAEMQVILDRIATAVPDPDIYVKGKT